MGIVSLRPVDDDDLAQRAAHGERAAMEALIRRHARAVWALCRRTLGDAQEADDVTQEAMLKAWRALSSPGGAGYQGQGKFRSWLLRIAQRTCLDHLRARRALVPLEDAPPPTVDAPLRAEPDERAALASAVEQLDPRQRAVLHAKYTLGLSGPEIASLLDLTPANVRVLLHRAIARLRGELK